MPNSVVTVGTGTDRKKGLLDATGVCKHCGAALCEQLQTADSPAPMMVCRQYFLGCSTISTTNLADRTPGRPQQVPRRSRSHSHQQLPSSQTASRVYPCSQGSSDPPTPSFDADNDSEDSLLGGPSVDMQEDELSERHPLLPQYPGDDTRPTSKKELAGWYSYGWAAEVFAVCAMGMKSSSCRPLGSLD